MIYSVVKIQVQGLTFSWFGINPFISFQSERLKPFIPKNFTAKQTEDYVIKALEYYHRYQLRQKERDR